MKWIMCLNRETPLFSIYVNLVKVAVLSCRKHTSLEPFFIYDGSRNQLVEWLEAQGVQVVCHQSVLKDQIQKLSRIHGEPFWGQVGSGAFLRVDIPFLAEKKGWNDEYVFYTDCDVMFTGETSDLLDTNNCKFFSVAPEFDVKEIDSINTGAMLMNLKNLRDNNDSFLNFIRNNLLTCLKASWDQTAYQLYFNNRWNHLSPLLNWKPYWGRNEDARVIHFHGLKPHHRFAIGNGGIDKNFEAMVCNEYYEYCEIHDSYGVNAGIEKKL